MRSRHERSREYLNPDEVAKLLAANRNVELSRNPERDYCLLFMMARHGLRVSEACQLKLSGIDLIQKTIYIHRLKHGKASVHPIYKQPSQADRCTSEQLANLSWGCPVRSLLRDQWRLAVQESVRRRCRGCSVGSLLRDKRRLALSPAVKPGTNDPRLHSNSTAFWLETRSRENRDRYWR